MQPRSLYAATAAIYVAVTAYVVLRWESIPEPLPIHVGINGVDGWTEKTFFAATALVWIGAAMTLGIAATAVPPRIARELQPVPETSTIPFSETAAARLEQLCANMQQFIAEILLGMAVLLALAQLRLDFPGGLVNDFWIIAGLVVFIAFVIARQFKLLRVKDAGVADVEEQGRVDKLKLKASMGFYSEPADPMAAFVNPMEPGKVQLNRAHPAGRRQLRRMGVGIAVAMLAPIVIAVML